MPVQNAEIANIFQKVADLLEIQGANPFRVRAYRTAAQATRVLPRNLHELVAEGEDLSKLSGIGRDLAAKIAEIVETGHLSLLDELGREVAPELTELLAIPGLGPKRVRMLHDELGIETPEQLGSAAREGRIRSLAGFGSKTEAAILSALERQRGQERRTPWLEAEAVARDLVAYLRRKKGVLDVELAGSFRRRRETVGDLDILATCRRGTKVSDHFVVYEDVKEVVAAGVTRTTVILRSGLQVDLRVVPRASYGAALHYFTGSKTHNIAIRTLGVRQKLKINEYGVFRDEKRMGGRTESEVYRSVGLPYIEPELREDRGEIEAARRGRLPRLVQLREIRGDLHVHTRASDGRASIGQMAAAAKERGYEYLAISDHTQAVRVARGLDAERMRRHVRAIAKAEAKLSGIRLLRSAEIDILEDGSLDLPADVLDELDLGVCAVHGAFQLSRERQTERILRAMDDPHCHILAHPTGRLLGEREPYAVDVERLIEGARERGCFLELNAQPQRMDLADVHARAARDIGVKIAISTDAHSPNQLDFMRLGVGYARRGWLERGDVLNALPWRKLEKLLRR